MKDEATETERLRKLTLRRLRKRLIEEEIISFIKENRETIIKRAEKKLQSEMRQQSDDTDATKLPELP
jgi:hypothetical protein